MTSTIHLTVNPEEAQIVLAEIAAKLLGNEYDVIDLVIHVYSTGDVLAEPPQVDKLTIEID